MKEPGNEHFAIEYKRIKQSMDAYHLDNREPTSTDGVRGLWIQGPKGTGKTWKAKEISRSLYNEEPFVCTGKGWLDGYKAQKVIVVEDLDKAAAHAIGHSLKLWADRYEVTAEVKGGYIPLMHKMLIVTSNYTISELYQADDERATTMQRSRSNVMVEALEDRFRIESMLTRYQETR